MGASALVPLFELERRLPASPFRDRVHAARCEILRDDFALHGGDWRTWTWRDARIRERIRTMTANDRVDARPAGSPTES